MAMNDSASLFLFMFLVVPVFVVSSTSGSTGGKDCINSIFSFGDDIVDTGNYVILNPSDDVENNTSTPPPRPNITWDDVRSSAQKTGGEGFDLNELLHGFPQVNRSFGDVRSLPYGITYFNKPSGRFSNGRLIIDFVADALGLPFLPPYLARLPAEDYKNGGANFAVVGATVLDDDQFPSLSPSFAPNSPSSSSSISTAAGAPSGISLQIQLNWFKELLSSLCFNDTTATECQHFLKSSLFHFGGIGSYDYSLDKDKEDLHNLVPLVVDTISLTVNELISLGATELMVAGLLPIGCFPRSTSYKFSWNFDYRGCVSELNEVARYHNTQLQGSLQQLREKYPHANIIYVDYYNAWIQLFDTRMELGFNVKGNELGLSFTCCEARELDYFFYALYSESCEASNVCEKPEKYILWDRSHMSEAAYKFIALSVIAGDFTTPSFNMLSRKCSL